MVGDDTTTAERKPAISVIIPCYNAADTLDEQLAALARQRGDVEFEVLVCDNGSGDATLDIARRWQATLDQLRIVDASERRGPGFARNEGARHARAPMLAFCDADDVVSLTWVAAMHDALLASPFVGGQVDYEALNPADSYSFGYDEPTFVDSLFPWLPAAGAGNMGVHAGAFAAVGGFDPTLRTAEDKDLSWRLQLAGFPLVGSRDALIHIRKRHTLRGSFRQGFGYGRGNRQLQHKFQPLIDALARQHPLPGTGSDDDHVDGGTPSRGSSWRHHLARLPRIPRRIMRAVRDPLSQATELRHLGERLGERFGRIDRTAPQLAPADGDRLAGEGQGPRRLGERWTT